jgi:hypothetical protein
VNLTGHRSRPSSPRNRGAAPRADQAGVDTALQPTDDGDVVLDMRAVPKFLPPNASRFDRSLGPRPVRSDRRGPEGHYRRWEAGPGLNRRNDPSEARENSRAEHGVTGLLSALRWTRRLELRGKTLKGRYGGARPERSARWSCCAPHGTVERPFPGGRSGIVAQPGGLGLALNHSSQRSRRGLGAPTTADLESLQYWPA